MAPTHAVLLGDCQSSGRVLKPSEEESHIWSHSPNQLWQAETLIRGWWAGVAVANTFKGVPSGSALCYWHTLYCQCDSPRLVCFPDDLILENVKVCMDYPVEVVLYLHLCSHLLSAPGCHWHVWTSVIVCWWISPAWRRGVVCPRGALWARLCRTW